MERFDELASYIKCDEPKKSLILSLLSDFVFYESKIEELRKYPQYIINPNNPLQQKKLPVHNMIKDFQAQKNDIATKISRMIDGEALEESALIKALEQFNG
jgi:hypothetical protein